MLPAVVLELDLLQGHSIAARVELRPDPLADPFDQPLLLRDRGALPLVVTLRPPAAGGRAVLTAPERSRVAAR